MTEPKDPVAAAPPVRCVGVESTDHPGEMLFSGFVSVPHGFYMEVHFDLPAGTTLVPPRAAILQPPGARLRRILKAVCGKRMMTRVFEPIFNDMLSEWVELNVDGASAFELRMAKVRWALAWGRELVKVFVPGALSALLKKLWEYFTSSK